MAGMVEPLIWLDDRVLLLAATLLGASI